MKTDTTKILQLIELIYDAAMQPEIWPGFARKLCQVIPSTDSNIYVADVIAGRASMSFTMTPLEAVKIYFERYHQINPYYQRDMQHVRTGRIARSHEVCSPEEFEQTEFYQGYFRPLNLFHVINVTVLQEGDISGHLSLARSKEVGIYTDEEKHLLGVLLPHLQRAFRISHLLDGLRLEREVMSQILDKVPQGALIVSRTGHLIFANRSAEQMLAHNDGLVLDRQGNLESPSANDHQQLHQLIGTAGHANALLSAQSGGVFQLQRPSGLRPLSLLIAPLNHDLSHDNYHQPSVLIFITDPEQRMESMEAVLLRLYSLTPAEARLAAILVQGKSVAMAAAELHVTQNTARTHLKHIFEKTGAKRQSELVQLLLNSPAVLKS
jgi:DNA-binding CsgD family transcriptional regulator/PAS domain-containing protein